MIVFHTYICLISCW